MTLYRSNIACRAPVRGFTLVELMIVLVVVAILAAIAVPSYRAFVAEQEISGAEADLVSLSMNMENYLQNNTQYPAIANGASAIQGSDGLSGWIPAQGANFSYAITAVDNAATPPSYTLQATGGTSLLSGCTIALTSANARTLNGCTGGASTW